MLSSYIDPCIHWLHLHPNWSGVITFLIVFSETLVVIGSLIPGTVFMTAIGGLIGLGVIPLWPTLIAAIIGAIVGDGLSFWLGHHYHEHLREMWPFTRLRKWINLGEAFFLRHGGKSIFLGRFVGPVRAFMPVIGGMMQMNTKRYLVANLSASLIWAPLHMLPGYLLGAATKSLPPEAALKFISFILILLFLIWCTTWLIKRTLHFIAEKIDSLISKLNQYLMSTTHAFIRLILLDKKQPHSHRQLSTLLLALLCLLLFAFVFNQVSSNGFLIKWNHSVWHLLRSVRNLHLQEILLLITYLGEKKILIFLWLVVFIWTLYQNHWYTAMHWLVLPVLTSATADIIKNAVAYPRPLGLLLTPSGFSFPSGHTTLAVTFYGLIAVMVADHLPKYRKSVYFNTSVLIILIGFSRLYLGAHWLTDVLAGVCLGLFWICIAVLSLRHENYRLLPLSTLLSITTVSLLIGWCSYTFLYFKRDNHDYSLTWTIKYLSAEQWWKNQGTATPFYRHTRLGKRTELLNVQWDSPLAVIEASLKQNQWENVPRTPLSETLLYLTDINHRNQLPLFKQLYLDHKPKLMMKKSIQLKNINKKYWLVLRLWDSGVRFIDSEQTLWAGTVSFTDQTHPQYIATRIEPDEQGVREIISATSILEHDALEFTRKRINASERWHLPKQEYGHQYVLLVKAK